MAMASDATKPVHATSPPSKMLLAAFVASRIQIKAVRLVETSARQVVSGDKLPQQLDLAIKTEASLDPETLKIAVDVRCSLAARYADAGQEAQVPVSIAAVFRVEYSCDSSQNLTKESIDAFGELNGVYNVWPYWREYVQSVLVRMGLPPLTIPVFRPMSDSWPIPRPSSHSEPSTERQS
jgi:preprotein translocase subunit SecB